MALNTEPFAVANGCQHAITYGVVPPGFKQTIPSSGAPPPLVEGKVYEAGGPAFDANGGSMRFTIKEGNAVEVAKPN